MDTKKRLKTLELISALYRAKDIDSDEKTKLVLLLKEEKEAEIKRKLESIKYFAICKDLIEQYLEKEETEYETVR